MNVTTTEDVRFLDCYVRWSEEELVLGNDLFERRWTLTNGLLTPAAFRFKPTDTEWFAGPAALPAPLPETPLPEEPRAVSFKAEAGAKTVVSAEFLRFTLRAQADSHALTYTFEVFPGVAGAAVTLTCSGNTAAGPASADYVAAPAPTGIEAPDPTPNEFPELDCLERFAPKPLHLRFVQANFMDQTDRNNEVAYDRAWRLHASQQDIAAEGCLFAFEDVLTGAGLALLKEAPLPYARPVQSGPDARVHCRSTNRAAFYGHSTGGDGEPGYRFILLAYAHGHWGRTAALQAYQRGRRPYVPGRDGTLLTNTWGDRSQDGRIQEAFLLEEAGAAAKLGADVVQIDDGWETGRTANSVERTPLWEGYWAANPQFWEVDAQRFPRGLEPVAEQVEGLGMRLGLWFGPDSANDFANWEKDAAVLLDFHRRLGVDYFKLDGIKVRSKQGERNLDRFIRRVLDESEGAVVFDLDVTAEVRPGYWGCIDIGPCFVENRYTDWRRYWPWATLRTLWTLAHSVDPARLRIEFLNNARNQDKYAGDPLAPAEYSPAYLFATTLPASPLGWFEVSGLSPQYVEAVAELASIWRQHRPAWHAGTTWPIGDAPDGASWTGFLSLAPDERSGYLLAFRELHPSDTCRFALPPQSYGDWQVEILAGEGEVDVAGGAAQAVLRAPRSFVWARIERA